MKLQLAVSLLILFSSCIVSAAADTEEIRDKALHRKKPMSILLVAVNAVSRIMRISALGDALVRKGHNVTLCVSEGADLTKQVTERVGMSLLIAAPNLATEHLPPLRCQDFFEIVFFGIPEGAKCIMTKLTNDPSYSSAWDIVIADQAHAMYFTCLSRKWGVPFISFATTFDVVNLPSWPYPVYGSVYTDDLTFPQRFTLELYKIIFGVFVRCLNTFWLMSMDFDCIDYYHEWYYASEGYSPVIYSVAFGFEYPRPLLPMMHYVGPLTLESEETLSIELGVWLGSRAERSTVYISMGSMARLTKSMGDALINGILQTNYSVLWSLRESNRDILEGHTLSREHFHISSWLPQQTVLRNQAIAVAVLHGGMGGVSEALSNAIPLIVIPFFADQYDNAARVQHAGVGVGLDGSKLTAKVVLESIETVTSLKYRSAVQKLQKIFQHAGGVEKAADLVEFYQGVGYDHLVPAYLKYKWSWVQYYNVDVYALIMFVMFFSVLVAYKMCAWLYL